MEAPVQSVFYKVSKFPIVEFPVKPPGEQNTIGLIRFPRKEGDSFQLIQGAFIKAVNLLHLKGRENVGQNPFAEVFQ